MHDWLAHRSRATPGAVAEIEADDGTAHTYADLDERVEDRAGRLAALGVGVDDQLGVVLGTRPAFVDLAHAAMRLGAVLVPLNARLTARELAERVERVDLDLLVCGRDTQATAREAVGRAGENQNPDQSIPVASIDRTCRSPDHFSGNTLRAEVHAIDETDPEPFDLPAWEQDDPLVIAFTSGTTGRPRPVTLTSGNLFSSACGSAFRLGVRRSDRWLCCLPMYHVGGLAPIYRSVLYGTTVVVQEGFEADATLEALCTHDVSCVSLVPTMLGRLLDAGEPPDSLRFVLLGGAPIPEDLVERCENRGVPVHPTYGTTETASQVATARPTEAFENRGTVGTPLLFAEVSVVDESGSERPTGEPGEIVVSGPTVTGGYYDDPAATDRAFSGDGFHTGDVGYLDEGNRLYLIGRLDDRIVTGGETVDPGEVVTVLKSHENVHDAAVVGLEDPEWGQRVAALVAPAGNLTRESIEAHCRERLAGFKRPRTVAVADELPRTPSDTIDREAVRERLRENQST